MLTASIGYGKLARSIKLELQLPIYERTQDGMAMVTTCRAEYDRLIEQSPPPPEQAIKLFDKNFPTGKASNGFARPEISDIEAIELFDSVKEQTAISSVANVFKKNLNNAAGFGKKLFGIPAKVQEARKFSAAPTMVALRAPSPSGNMGGVLDELRALKNRGMVSKNPTDSEDIPVAIDINIEQTEEPVEQAPVESPPSSEPSVADDDEEGALCGR